MFKVLVAVTILVTAIIITVIACLALAPLSITDRDNGRTFDMLRFRTIRISLEANPSTGYQWQLVSPTDRSIIRLYYSTYTPQPTDRLGAGGYEEYKFRAIQPGKVTINLAYTRIWERAKPAKEFSVTVHVR